VKKIHLFLLLFAGVYGSLEEQVKRLEEKVSCLDGAVCKQDRDVDYTLLFEVLYWHPKTDLTEIGSTQTRNASTQALANGSSTPYMDFNWEFGFSIGMGYHFKKREWDLTAKYTRFQFNDSFTFSPGVTKQIQSNFGAAGSGNPFPVASMKGSHAIDYQTIVLALSRQFFLNGYIDIMPVIGVKSTWINQMPHIINQTENGDNLSQHIYLSEKTNGLGPIAMLNSNWCLCNGWSIYTESGLALLFTKYRGNMSVEGGEKGGVNYSDFRQSNKERKHYVTPNMMISLGMRYRCEFDEGKRVVIASLGYESQYYVNQSYLMQNRSVEKQEVTQGAWLGRNLALYGVTAHISCQF
jgi:hypothetical protein